MSSSDAKRSDPGHIAGRSAKIRSGDQIPVKGIQEDRPHDNDDAVDEEEEVDGEFVTLQKTLSQKRREIRDGSEARLKKSLPCPFLPNLRPLSISDLESCVALETTAFHNPHFRASREKFEYRLTRCPELSLGIFCTIVPEQVQGWQIETLATAKPVETDRADGAVSVLLAHIVSTRCCAEVVADQDMAVPGDWKILAGRSAATGHQESGRTVALHSLAVAPKLQGCGLGKMIVKAYLQQVKDSGVADRVSLLCQDHLVNYYLRFGFRHLGESKANFGGGGWHNMTVDLSSPPKTPF